ncbi:hypothetical protein [Halobacillus naozhouensis]|uniref:Uncharacterized protein n=1 Tax=Halobacillus naozhouensis TaxID=554880 RepID=A0ABY8J096_9BACI|nr:hypothetical protein [Halobacillus naozhouensis]WFT74180.1 hypothetical protein P9989_17715 [Halobacillus naozhouensis]
MISKELMLLDRQPERSRNQSLMLAGYGVFIWSIAYMLPHLYWAMAEQWVFRF